MYFVMRFLFFRYHIKIYSLLLALRILLSLCNRVCKVFKRSEHFTLTQRFINCLIYIKVPIEKH